MEFCVITSTDGHKIDIFEWQAKFIEAMYPGTQFFILVPPNFKYRFKKPVHYLDKEINRQSPNISLIHMSWEHHEVCDRLAKNYRNMPAMYYWLFAHHYIPYQGFYIDCGDVFILSQECFDGHSFNSPFATFTKRTDTLTKKVPATGIVDINPSLISDKIDAGIKEIAMIPRDFLKDATHICGDEIALYHLGQIVSCYDSADYPGHIHAKIFGAGQPLYELFIREQIATRKIKI